MRWPLPAYDPLIAALPKLRGDMEALADRVTPVPIASVKLLNPVPNPSKVIGAPVNYHAHIDEANADAQINFGKTIKTIDHYGVFLKSNSSLSGPSEPVAVVEKERRTDHEVELAAIIGETCFDVPEEGALKYIAGYSIGLDMTIRGPEERSLAQVARPLLGGRTLFRHRRRNSRSGKSRSGNPGQRRRCGRSRTPRG